MNGSQIFLESLKKEGVKHIENELSQLKQKIEKNIVEVDDDDDSDVPDLTPSDSK